MSGMVYHAINAAAAELSESGIAKAHTNKDGNYQYRSIDDVMNALAPLLARHKLCALPRILDRSVLPALTGTHVCVRAAFDLVSAMDGSSHTVESFGEAFDDGDKATAKAISAAYKSAMLQTFCIPVPQEDAEANPSRVRSLVALPEPPEGWDAWVEETSAILQSCGSAEAIERLCETRRQSLVTLHRAQPALYARLGELITRRLLDLKPATQPKLQRTKGSPLKTKRNSNASAEAAQAA